MKIDDSEAVAKDSSYIMTWLLESIQKQETADISKIDIENMQLLEELSSDRSKTDPERFNGVLTSKNLGKAITNISEYCLIEGQ